MYPCNHRALASLALSALLCWQDQSGAKWERWVWSMRRPTNSRASPDVGLQNQFWALADVVARISVNGQCCAPTGGRLTGALHLTLATCSSPPAPHSAECTPAHLHQDTAVALCRLTGHQDTKADTALILMAKMYKIVAWIMLYNLLLSHIEPT